MKRNNVHNDDINAPGKKRRKEVDLKVLYLFTNYPLQLPLTQGES
jgi:hypothetical protein